MDLGKWDFTANSSIFMSLIIRMNVRYVAYFDFRKRVGVQKH